MARYIGIDIGTSQVRAAVLSTGYKRSRIEALQEVPLEGAPSVSDAVATAARGLLPHSDGVCVAIDGDSSFVHRLSLPATARKQLQEVLPFELEAQMPIDIAELVYDFRVLRSANANGPIELITAAARTVQVQARIDLIKGALGREPDRVGCGPLAMGNLAVLAPELRGAAPIALVDLGSRRTEVSVLQNGEPAFVRTLSRGVAGLPETAPALVSDLRQTFLAFLAVSDQPVAELILIGGGANAAGADAYLAHALGIPVRGLPALDVDLANPEQALLLPRFGKAIALAAGLTSKAVDLNLRSGALTFQRGYGILKEKAPLLTGLAAALTVSFVFASWAELRALSHEKEQLSQALEVQSKAALGEASSDPERVEELLNKAKNKDETDPMPHMDAFDVMVEISNDVPSNVVHDVDELEMQRAHVKLSAIVGTTADAQAIANKIGENKCVQDAKIVKVTQVVNGDRQKYVLEFDAKCPEDGLAKKKPKTEEKPAPEETP